MRLSKYLSAAMPFPYGERCRFAVVTSRGTLKGGGDEEAVHQNGLAVPEPGLLLDSRLMEALITTISPAISERSSSRFI